MMLDIYLKEKKIFQGMGPGNMGPPLGPPLGPHNSQMGGHMGTQGMVQGPYHQGWGTPPQQQGYPPQGYGAPQGPQGYQGWGAGQQLQQWGAPNYGSPGGQQYGSFGKSLVYSSKIQKQVNCELVLARRKEMLVFTWMSAICIL